MDKKAVMRWDSLTTFCIVKVTKIVISTNTEYWTTNMYQKEKQYYSTSINIQIVLYRLDGSNFVQCCVSIKIHLDQREEKLRDTSYTQELLPNLLTLLKNKVLQLMIEEYNNKSKKIEVGLLER